MPALGGPSQTDGYDQEGLLKGAYLMGNGNFATATLHRVPRWLLAADISADQVVWSEEIEEVGSELYQAAILLECGDWGYKSGDLDGNCRIDLRDLAIFAQDWLECTLPGEEGCDFGLMD